VEIRPRDIKFLDAGGSKAWMDELEKRDEVSYDAIVARLERVEDGNFGDCGPVGEGVFELRFIKTGPGYRVYFGEHDDMVIILTAGKKSTQTQDIKRAKVLWSDYNA
jgi:putative addiction module killer protein